MAEIGRTDEPPEFYDDGKREALQEWLEKCPQYHCLSEKTKDKIIDLVEDDTQTFNLEEPE